MHFLYVPLHEEKTAKKRILKRMLKNAENEPKYAMTTDKEVDYEAYLSKLIELNDKLYALQTDLNPQGSERKQVNITLRGISPLITHLLKETRTMDISNYSSKDIGDIQEQVGELEQRNVSIQENLKSSKIMNALNKDTMTFALKIYVELNDFLELVELKLSKPMGQFRGGMPIHLL